MKRQDGKPRLFSFTLRDFLIFAAIFICALVLCTLLRRSDISDGFASSGIRSRGAAHLALHERISVRHACRIPERYRHQTTSLPSPTGNSTSQ